jgi:ABC-type glycerol-3-phosphate transport system substrate-binding protein
MRNRVLVTCVALFALVALASWAGGTGEKAGSQKVLKITGTWGYWNDPTPPADRTLTDYATQLIVQRTGVSADWPITPQDWTSQQYWTNVLAANNVPEIYDVGAAWIDPDNAKFLTEKGIARELTPDMIKKYMPNYVARIQKYGQSVDKILNANLYQGKLLSVPTQFQFSAFPDLMTNEAAKQPRNDYYAIAFRDDILKKIFPNARTEKELQDLLVKQGSLSVQDIIGDIPIKNLDDLKAYLEKVKALNLKVGDKPVIPGAITASSESLGALDWSLRTIVGFAWEYPFMMGTPPDFKDSVYPKLTPQYKAYMKWWNDLYNEGLIDPEMFVMKNDQFNAKQINGEYAVINRWWYVADAEKVGKDRGYGWRYFPVFYGQLDPNLFSNNVMYLSLGGSPVVITSSAKDADMPKILGWLDWYMSEERDSLAYWGMPDWYTGTGKDRRYTWEWAVLEDWALYGKAYNHDGSYYGLQTTYAKTYNPIKDVKFPLGPLAFFASNLTYPDAPYFVYNKDPKKVLESTDLFTYCQNVLRAARYDEYTFFTTATDPYSKVMALPAVAAWDSAGSNDPNYTPIIVKMITDKQANFEQNWNAFANMLENWGGPNGLQKAMTAEETFMSNYYKSDILPDKVANPFAK